MGRNSATALLIRTGYCRAKCRQGAIHHTLYSHSAYRVYCAEGRVSWQEFNKPQPGSGLRKTDRYRVLWIKNTHCHKSISRQSYKKQQRVNQAISHHRIQVGSLTKHILSTHMLKCPNCPCQCTIRNLIDATVDATAYTFAKTYEYSVIREEEADKIAKERRRCCLSGTVECIMSKLKQPTQICYNLWDKLGEANSELQNN